MLKILAIQVLKECEEYIMRCLEPEVMYYLCHDYEITQTLNGGLEVRKRGDNISMWYLKNSIAYVKTAK